MTENKRIILNVLATYGRSVISLAIGLFTSRWVLLALGNEDFGLYGMVGGLIFFLSFINYLFTDSIARFYAIGQGNLRKNGMRETLEDNRKWFSVSLALMMIVPTLVIIIGYPIGAWAINNWLNIAPEKIGDCICILRCSCIATWMGFATIPFSAMYRAKQYIAELTIYSFAQSLMIFIFSFYMVRHPGNWLSAYAIVMCVIAIAPQILISIRAAIIFPECSIRIRNMIDIHRLKELVSFAGWSFFGNLGWMLKVHGVAVLVNKYYGAAFNASISVSNQVSGHSNSLSAAVQGAFSPAIITAYGAGDFPRFRRLVDSVCRLKAALFVIFMLPLVVEINEVLSIWLKSPPPSAAILCVAALVSVLYDNCTNGFYIAICANGNISGYQFASGIALALALPMMWIASEFGAGMVGVGAALILSQIIASSSSVYFARRLMSFSILKWVKGVIVPILVICVIGSSLSALLKLFIDQGILRLLVSSFMLEVVLIPLIWCFVLDRGEREYISHRINVLFKSNIGG